MFFNYIVKTNFNKDFNYAQILYEFVLIITYYEQHILRIAFLALMRKMAQIKH